ncbi:MAG: hypothetical protein A2X28_00065 [Elusimicrobia bacterium GWA2_56_46]|nr:MAG: hypothetical protein A2X28_00065 [Elusimicrobia bacterium GWA2_56_46]OGR53704.1 MAG: hypothetical protein A2X39_03025 [Elusimicrobia bacterium GWC2_56_31]HBB66824.1 hypothetical protein [Elusimicrobiota bacterium]HBW23157.1 hypothetical protein [Elusimicrobiota bacterium]
MIGRLLGRLNSGLRSFPDTGAAPGAGSGLIVGFYFFLLLIALLTRLETLVLLENDDMTHAAMGLSILTTGDWFTMHQGVIVSMIKPPLYFWIEAALFKCFGASEYWARFPSAVMGFLSIVLAYKIVRRLWDEKTAFLSLLVFSYSFFFLKYSRRAMLDVPVAFATTLGIYALVKAEYDDKKKFYALFGVSAALGYYFKGVQGLYLFGIAPVYFALSGRPGKAFSRYFLGAAALSLGLIALWAAPQTLEHGGVFIQSQSALGPLLNMGIGSKHNHFYQPFLALLGIYWPWIPFSLFGLWLSVKGLREAADARRSALLLSWFAVILLALSVSSAFYLRYLIPLMIPFGIFAALALARLIKDADMGYAKRLSAAVYACLVTLIVCFPVKLDRQGTEYFSFYRTVNQVAPKEAGILLYKEKVYKFVDGLVFYSGRTLDKQVTDEEALLAEYSAGAADKFTVASAADFKELAASPKMSRARLDVAASSDNWVLFKVRGIK